MNETVEYMVIGMSCDHCRAAVTREVLAVNGVTEVDIDLGAKRVLVHGEDLDDDAIRAAIDEAGYEAA